MGSKGGGSKRTIVDYYMSIHYGICHGPVDALLGIYVKERDAWPGTTKYRDDETVVAEDENVFTFKDFMTAILGGSTGTGSTVPVATENGPLTINRMDLFGGDRKEGGVRGTAYFLNGNQSQVMPEVLATKLKQTPETCPAYRGLSSVFFYGGPSKGFLWGQNNPYLPPAWFTVFRRPRGLNLTKATIQRGDNPPDANPAHIVYECLTNTTWGMGSPATLIDVASIEASADLFIAEKFGLSMVWSQQATIEDFVKEVLDHVQASLYLNPRTGLLTMKPIRGDYDPDTLPEFGPDNCVATNRQRKAWAETINEIVVTWTNPLNEKEQTITFQDLANIAMQGAPVSDNRNYYGIRNAELASEVGVRDLRSASYPMFTCDIEVDRSAWSLNPGDTLRLTWPEDGLEKVVMRVGPVEYGAPGNGKIKANLIEDVFALEQSEWVNPPQSGWVDPSSDPEPFQFTQFFTVPYPSLARAGFAETVEAQYPRVAVGVLAQQNDVDTSNFELHGEIMKPNGQAEIGYLSTMLQTSMSETLLEMNPEAETQMDQAFGELGVVLGDHDPEPGDLLIIGEGGDTETEVAMLDSLVDDVWTLRRGLYDTVPRYWPAGTRIWYLPTTYGAVDTYERIGDEYLEYKLLPRTSKGLLPFDIAPVESFTTTERPHLPFRPANVSVNGSYGFGKISLTEALDLVVTWSTRNRLTEDVVARWWDDASVTPEAGQTTKLVVTNEVGDLIQQYLGLTGESYTIPYTEIAGYRRVFVKVLAEKDGLESLQGVEREIEYRLPGYSFGYGSSYGTDYGE